MDYILLRTASSFEYYLTTNFLSSASSNGYCMPLKCVLYLTEYIFSSVSSIGCYISLKWVSSIWLQISEALHPPLDTTVQPRYHDSQGTDETISSFPGIDTSIRTFNCTVLAAMAVGDIRWYLSNSMKSNFRSEIA